MWFISAGLYTTDYVKAATSELYQYADVVDKFESGDGKDFSSKATHVSAQHRLWAVSKRKFSLVAVDKKVNDKDREMKEESCAYGYFSRISAFS